MGGFTIAVNCVMPYIPRFETVNEPPEISSLVSLPLCALSASSAVAADISAGDFVSAA